MSKYYKRIPANNICLHFTEYMPVNMPIFRSSCTSHLLHLLLLPYLSNNMAVCGKKLTTEMKRRGKPCFSIIEIDGTQPIRNQGR